MLGVADVGQSLQFYRDALGFECFNTFEESGTLFWAFAGTGGRTAGPDSPFKVELMFTRIDPSCSGGDDREGRRQLFFYFYPEDVVGLHRSLKEMNYMVSDLRVTIYGMKEFELEDPDGYQLWFGESTDEAPSGCE